MNRFKKIITHFFSDLYRKLDRKKRENLIVALAVLVCSVVCCSTFAFIYTKTAPVVNEFQGSAVGVKVDETFENNIKTNVAIENTGTAESYVRAMIVVTWKAKDGSVAPEVPEKDVDYELELGTSSNWVLKDGMYYYTKPLVAGGKTDVLISRCVQLKEKAGYQLSVEIITQAIQSSPVDAVIEAWNVEPATLANSQEGQQ